MKRTKTVGKSLAVILVLGAFGAASASATAPEFGRCLKQATKSLSNYDSGKCVKLASEDAGTEAENLKKGNYQWFPGVVKSKFMTQIKAGTIVVLETVAGTKVVCTGETSTGEYAGTTEVRSLVIKFTGCETSKGGCESEGAGDGRIDTAPLAGTLGFETIAEDPAKDHLALELHAEGGGNIAEFHCFGVPYVVSGSLLHKIAANAMKLTATERFTASKGKQKPDHFAGGVVGEHILELSVNGNPFAQAGLSFTTILTNEEKVAASTVN